jgi:hypothetical protein
VRNPSEEDTAKGDGKQIPGSRQGGTSGKVFNFIVKLSSHYAILEKQETNRSEKTEITRNQAAQMRESLCLWTIWTNQ